MKKSTNQWWRIVISIVCLVLVSMCISSCGLLTPKGKCTFVDPWDNPYCFDDLTENECDDQGGNWTEGKKCD